MWVQRAEEGYIRSGVSVCCSDVSGYQEENGGERADANFVAVEWVWAGEGCCLSGVDGCGRGRYSTVGYACNGHHTDKGWRDEGEEGSAHVVFLLEVRSVVFRCYFDGVTECGLLYQIRTEEGDLFSYYCTRKYSVTDEYNAHDEMSGQA